MCSKAARALHQLESGRKMADWLIRGFKLRNLGQVRITPEVKTEMCRANNGKLIIPRPAAEPEIEEGPPANEPPVNQLTGMLTRTKQDACKDANLGVKCLSMDPVEKERKVKLFAEANDELGPQYYLRAKWADFFQEWKLEADAVISIYARCLFEDSPFFVIRFDGYTYPGKDDFPPTTDMDAVAEDPILTHEKLAACLPTLLGGIPTWVGLCI